VVGDGPTYVYSMWTASTPCTRRAPARPKSAGTPTLKRSVSCGITRMHLIGGDVVEVAPPYDQTAEKTALVGATMMFEIIC